MGSRRRLHEGRLYAGTKEGESEGGRAKDGFPPRSSRGQAYAGMTEGGKAKVEGRKMGPRIREDNGRGAGMVRV